MSKKKLWSDHNNMKSLMEGWRGFVSEEAIAGFDPSEFPNPLPADQTKSFMQKGWDDSPDDGESDSSKKDDEVDVELKSSVAAGSLMPSQTAVFLGKALGMSMVPKLSSGGDIGAVISEDNHILDGHHRWAATHLRNPNVDIIGTKVMLPITQLIPVLRAAGDAYGNARKGEPKGGDLNMFSSEAANPEVIKEMIETGKYMDPKFYNREKLEAHVKSIGGIDAIVEAVKRMQSAASKAYGGSGLGDAPPRKEMPVLEPKKAQVKGAAKRLQKGTIDVAPPYGDLEVGKAAHGGEEIGNRKKRMSKVVSENSKRKIRAKSNK